jgi:hypothetical protein
MELLTTSDLTLKSVVDRVRRAVVVDDDVLDRDKAPVASRCGVKRGHLSHGVNQHRCGKPMVSYLVGGLEHLDYFPIYWECHHPN